MKRQVSITLALILFAAANAAAKSPTACELLSRRDVKAVQGETFAEAKLTEGSVNGMNTSQCFYRLPTFVNSISLDVIRPSTESTDAQELWQTLTGKRTEKMAGKGRANGQPVSGLGDEAIWAGNKTAGALYVLQDHAILRISIGGAGTEEDKLEKTKKLAARALAKM